MAQVKLSRNEVLKVGKMRSPITSVQVEHIQEQANQRSPCNSPLAQTRYCCQISGPIRRICRRYSILSVCTAFALGTQLVQLGRQESRRRQLDDDEGDDADRHQRQDHPPERDRSHSEAMAPSSGAAAILTGPGRPANPARVASRLRATSTHLQTVNHGMPGPTASSGTLKSLGAAAISRETPALQGCNCGVARPPEQRWTQAADHHVTGVDGFDLGTAAAASP